MARLDINVDVNGASQITKLDRDLKKVEKTSQAASKSISAMGVAIGAIVTSQAIRAVANYADAWTSMESKIKLVTSSSYELANTQDLLLKLANDTRQSMESTVTLYTRITRATQHLNITDKERLRVTETINKALVVSGATATEASSAILQLSQAMASGVLRGEEYNSLAENGSEITMMLAKSLGVTTGELREMAKEGELTTEVVLKALADGAEEVDKKFAKMAKTLGQSMTEINNGLTQMVGNFNEVTGAVDGLSTGLSAVGRGFSNFDFDKGGLLEWFGIIDSGAIHRNLALAEAPIKEIANSVSETAHWIGESADDAEDLLGFEEGIDFTMKQSKASAEARKDAVKEAKDAEEAHYKALADSAIASWENLQIDIQRADVAQRIADNAERNARALQSQIVGSTGSSYDQFLDTTNNAVISAYDLGATADEMESIFAGELGKYDKAQAERDQKQLEATYKTNNNYYGSGSKKPLKELKDIIKPTQSSWGNALNYSGMAIGGMQAWGSQSFQKPSSNFSNRYQGTVTIKQEHETEAYIDMIVDVTDALDGMRTGLEGIIDGLQEDYYSKAREALFGGTDYDLSFAQAKASAQEAWDLFQSDQYNQEYLDNYNDRMDDVISTLDEFKDSSAYNSSVEQEFAKHVALRQVKEFQEGQLDTLEEADLQLAVLQSILDATADGNVTREEAYDIASQSKQILTDGTLETNDTQAISWLTAVNNATKDGNVSLADLKAITNTTKNITSSQTGILSGTRDNTDNIGKYKVINEYGRIDDDTQMLGYRIDTISQTFAPYKSG